MIPNFNKEVAELEELFEKKLESKQKLQVMMVLAAMYDKGLGDMKRRCLDIVAHKALNAAELRAEINRPIR